MENNNLEENAQNIEQMKKMFEKAGKEKESPFKTEINADSGDIDIEVSVQLPIGK